MLCIYFYTKSEICSWNLDLSIFLCFIYFIFSYPNSKHIIYCDKMVYVRLSLENVVDHPQTCYLHYLSMYELYETSNTSQNPLQLQRVFTNSGLSGMKNLGNYVQMLLLRWKNSYKISRHRTKVKLNKSSRKIDTLGKMKKLPWLT